MFEHLDMFMFAGVCLALMAGFPVAFTLAGVALVFAFVGYGAGVFDLSFLSFLPQRIFGTMINEVLIAVPLFIFMGTMLERAKLAEDLLENLSYLFRNIKGGLGVAVCIVGALLAASTGIVGATVVTMGLLALPTMLKRGYDPALATGVIAATGTLGQIIPPSIVLVLLGDVIANAYQQAQLEQGIFTPETISVGQLFAGSLVPGFVLVGLYIIYQIGVAWRYPEKAPTPDYDEDDINLTWRNIAIALAPPILLIVSVLGSILGGIATPTEAAAVGAIGTLLLAGAKLASLQSHAQSRYVVRIIWAGAVALVALIILTTNTDPRLDMLTPATIAAIICTSVLLLAILVAIITTFRDDVLRPAMRTTMHTTSMVFMILIGAALFSLVFRGLGGDDTIEALLHNLPGGVWGAIAITMLIMFLLGFFLDFIEITFVIVPLVAPILLTMGVDPVWLGVMMAVNLQTSFLTPPFGFALFYLRGVTPPSVPTSAIYRGAIPFVIIQLLMLVLLAFIPELATWLPEQIFGD